MRINNLITVEFLSNSASFESNRLQTLLDGYDPYNPDEAPFYDYYSKELNQANLLTSFYQSRLNFINTNKPSYENELLYNNILYNLYFNPYLDKDKTPRNLFSAINFLKYWIDEFSGNPNADEIYHLSTLYQKSASELLADLNFISSNIQFIPTTPYTISIELQEIKYFYDRFLTPNPLSASEFSSTYFLLDYLSVLYREIYTFIVTIYNDYIDGLNSSNNILSLVNTLTTAFRVPGFLSPYEVLGQVLSPINYLNLSYAMEVARIPVRANFGNGLETRITEIFLYIFSQEIVQGVGLQENPYTNNPAFFTGFALPENGVTNNHKMRALPLAVHTNLPQGFDKKTEDSPYIITINSISNDGVLDFDVQVNIAAGYEDVTVI